MNADGVTKPESKPYYEYFPATVLCPCCGLHMSYVGSKKQDLAQAYKVGLDQHWETVSKISDIKNAPKVAIPDGYKCFFCGVMPLSTSKDTWRLQFGHFSEKDHKNAALRAQVLERDKNTCCDCNLQMPRHMEVRHKDENHSNNDLSNLVCVCPFCHMRDHLGPTGFANAAVVVGSTQMPQAVINLVVLISWYITSRIHDIEDIRDEIEDEANDYRLRLLKTARNFLNELQVRGTRWMEMLSKAAADPYTFGSMLTRLRYEEAVLIEPTKLKDKPYYKRTKELHNSAESTEVYRNRVVDFAAMSLLPNREAFADQCKDWFTYFDKNRNLDTWLSAMKVFLETHEIADEATLHGLVKDWHKMLAQEHSENHTAPIAPSVYKQPSKPSETTQEAAAPVVAATAAVAALAAAAMEESTAQQTQEHLESSQEPAETVAQPEPAQEPDQVEQTPVVEQEIPSETEPQMVQAEASVVMDDPFSAPVPATEPVVQPQAPVAMDDPFGAAEQPTAPVAQAEASVVMDDPFSTPVPATEPVVQPQASVAMDDPFSTPVPATEPVVQPQAPVAMDDPFGAAEQPTAHALNVPQTEATPTNNGWGAFDDGQQQSRADNSDDFSDWGDDDSSNEMPDVDALSDAATEGDDDSETGVSF